MPTVERVCDNYIVARAADLLNYKSFQKLKESPRLLGELILDELILEMSNGPNECVDDICWMTINKFRMKLAQRGLDLDVDGSKKVRVSSLEE